MNPAIETERATEPKRGDSPKKHNNEPQKYDIEIATGIPWKRRKKTYRYLWQLACREDVIRAAFYKMRRKKTKRKDIQMAEANLDEWVGKIRLIIMNTKPDGWQVEHPELAFRPPRHDPVTVRERGKERTIYVPSMVELWIQHVIVMILEPIIRGSAYPHSYSSFPHRGGLRGRNALERWIRSGKGVRNFAQCDIRHFYGHVRRDIVMEKLRGRIQDEFFLNLIEVCLTHFPNQLPLGFYLSQWLANFLLQELDYGLKQEVGIDHVLRYMDNLTLADESKKKLHEGIRYAMAFLGQNRLSVKGDWRVSRFEYVRKDGTAIGNPISAMGWVFHRQRVAMRKGITLHLSTVARRLGGRQSDGKPLPLGDCKSYASLMGWVEHSDTYGWYKCHVEPFVRYKKVKGIISRHDKEEWKHGDRMEEGMVLGAA